MRINRKVLSESVIGLAIAVLIGAALCVLYHALLPLYIRGFMFLAGKKDQQKQLQLLCNTDYRMLLGACRQLSKRVDHQELEPGRYYVGYDQDPDVSGFPHAILNLRPSYVFIKEDGSVRLEMIGGLGHFGVVAYPEDYEKPSWSVYGDKELIPGLWYYDDGYKDNPEYRKKIDSLVESRR